MLVYTYEQKNICTSAKKKKKKKKIYEQIEEATNKYCYKIQSSERMAGM
jgi:predicted GTPase